MYQHVVWDNLTRHKANETRVISTLTLHTTDSRVIGSFLVGIGAGISAAAVSAGS